MKPEIPPSYEVHISPATARGTTSSAGPGFCVLRGYDLRTILSVVTGKDATRIILPASLEDNQGYDFVLVLPRAEDQATINRILQQGIEKYFQVSMALEKRTMDAYVMTALEGKTPPAKDPNETSGGSASWSSQLVEIAPTDDGRPPTIQEIRKSVSTGTVGISAYSDTIDEFRRTLEDALQRPIADETNLQGTHDFRAQGEARSASDFLQQLRDQLGLVLTQAQRRVEMLVVKLR
jgi:uncharacterized protein (TIGR03435 family)